MFNKYSFNLCLCLLDAPWTPGQNSDRDLVTLPKHAPGTRAAMRQLWQPGSGRGRGGGQPDLGPRSWGAGPIPLGEVRFLKSCHPLLTEIVMV